MRLLLSVLLISLSLHAGAQTIMPFEFTSEEENKLLKENDTVKYYVASHDTSKIVAINEDGLYYKLLGKNRGVIDEGGFVMDGEKYLQDGKWTRHFENGKTKVTGYFHKGKPVGTWEEFGENGKLKAVSNYALIIDKDGSMQTCMSGTNETYYSNGNLKTRGFYAAEQKTVEDTIEVEDPVSGNKVLKSISHSAYKKKKTGHWEYYTENGELEKKEDL